MRKPNVQRSVKNIVIKFLVGVLVPMDSCSTIEKSVSHGTMFSNDISVSEKDYLFERLKFSYINVPFQSNMRVSGTDLVILSFGQMTRTTPERTPSPIFRTTPAGGRLPSYV
ncbi:hypothetical protein AVEN_177687-1 [Araneus ventricosus]|uniref:Uncharacterized protein n=1 Tax=Araneus ventricosus TaxID=182803 RepID=A0A4Y2TX76_ARAVE|nr:hypothetical protein AVEN_177687-1 [Araneus ventricosus]